MHPVRLTTVLQPIVSLADPGSPRAAEALARFPDGRSPDTVFAAARETGSADRLELACIETHLAALPYLPAEIALALNLSTDTVTRHADFLALRLRAVHRLIIVELTEESDGDDLAAIGILRAAGIAIALDDAGAGRTGPQRIRRVAPDLVKIDGALLQAAQTVRAARDLVREITAASTAIDAEIVAEGLESVTDVACAIAFGASMGQGYAFGAPVPPERFARRERSA
jgi:EAL domain-containing protein (putative c-di-GMP-specific phosphodiesterase class I)